MTFVKAKTKDGAEVEVELPEGYGLRAEIIAAAQEAFEVQLKKRLARARAETVEKAVENPEERAKLIERLAAHLPKPDGNAGEGGGTKGGKPSKEQVEQLRAEFEAAHVRPLLEQLQKAQAKLGNLRAQGLLAEIASASQALKVKPELLRPLFDGGEPAILAMLRAQLGPDDETDRWYVKRGDSFAISAKKPGENMGVLEFMEALKGKPEFAHIFVDERQSGADFRQPGGGGSLTDDLSKLSPEARMTLARERGLK
jgi:hypothetical protein